MTTAHHLRPWPRLWTATVLHARAADRGDDRRSGFAPNPPGQRAVLYVRPFDCLPFGYRALSPVTLALEGAEPEPVSIVRSWHYGCDVREVAHQHGIRGRTNLVALVVGPIAREPAAHVGALATQVQARPLCPCQRHSAGRRLAGECVCRIGVAS